MLFHSNLVLVFFGCNTSHEVRRIMLRESCLKYVMKGLHYWGNVESLLLNVTHYQFMPV